MSAHEIKVYVRFNETDAAGHINNTSYFLYLEEARTKYFYEMGIVREEEAASPVTSFILASTKCDYVAQAYGGTYLKIITTVSNIGTKSFTFDHVVRTLDSKVIAHATATLVSFNYSEQRTEPIPDDIRVSLEGNIVT